MLRSTRARISGSVLVLMLAAIGLWAAPPDDAAPPMSADEQAIRARVAEFTKLFDAGDAKGLAELFTPRAEITDEGGQVTRGRDAIAEIYAELFRDNAGAKIEINVHSIRFSSDSSAIEEGASTIVTKGPAPSLPSQYSVQYVKQNGGWFITSARDIPDSESVAHGELAQLEWLVGDWQDENEAGAVATSYRWTDNHVYLVGEFVFHVAGEPVFSGSHRIGWDPVAKQIRSWSFFSEGGFSQGLWSNAGNQWVVKVSGVTRQGENTTSTAIYRPDGPGRFIYDSRDRTVGAFLAPPTGPVVVTRHPPAPGPRKPKS